MLNKSLKSELSFNYNGKLVSLETPKIMGILNITPDSFYDGDLDFNKKDYVSIVNQMIDDGADIIDVGGMSTKPGSKEVSEEEELNRVVPVITQLVNSFPDVMFSIDTYRSKVAKKALELGVGIVNDISGGTFDDQMYDLVREFQCVYIAMHIKGTPDSMQKNTDYVNVTVDVVKALSSIKNNLVQKGVNDIIIDPGFGFGKSLDQNFEMLKYLNHFKLLGFPILVGVSRKSMIYKTLEINSDEALNGTTILNTVALLNGASILRVHDVKEAKECVLLTQKIL
jgi:dihydropteroate synthase